MSFVAQFANKQPTGYVNYIKKVTIIGATGQVGKYITANLLKNNSLTVSALTRIGGSSKVPQGVHAIEVDYGNHAKLVEALQGQEMLIATLPARGADDLPNRLVDACVDAGVKYYVPNEWGYDSPSEQHDKESILGVKKRNERAYILSKGLPWIGIANGFWYEYSLSGGTNFFGINAQKKTAVLYDEGSTRISVSTWEQTGRAAAALVSLPILPQDANDKSATISSFVNGFVRVHSFTLSQRDMLNAVQTVTCTTDKDWKIDYKPVKEVHAAAMERLQQGDFSAFVTALYSRAFFPPGEVDYVKRDVLDNEKLKLPKEDLLEATKYAVQLTEEEYISKLFASRQ